MKSQPFPRFAYFTALLVLLPSVALAQVSPYPLGVTAPIFGLPASAVNGGGGFSPSLLGPESCTVPAYSFITAPTNGWGGSGTTTICGVVGGTQRLGITSTAVTSTVPFQVTSASNSYFTGGGKFGVGTNNPIRAFEIGGDPDVRISGASGAGNKWEYKRDADTNPYAYFMVGGGGGNSNWRYFARQGTFATDTVPVEVFSITGTTGAIGMVGTVVAEGAVGVPVVAKVGRITAQSSNATIATLTTPAVDGSYEVSANMNVTASTTLITTLTCTYTDESNTARTMILPVASLAGSFIAGGAITGAGATVWETPMMHIRVKASTAITILTSAGTFTGVTYTADAVIKQMK